MSLFRRQFASKDVKHIIQILEDIGVKSDSNTAFQLVRGILENGFLGDQKGVAALVEQGISPKEQAYNALANITVEMAESGQYHVYRGVLGIVGEDLLRLFDLATDELVQLGTIDAHLAKEQKAQVRENIKGVG